MLQRMHDNAQSWVTWVIVIVIILAFGLWGTEKFFVGDATSGPNAVVVKVNDQKIYKHQVQQFERNLPVQYQQLKQPQLQQLVIGQLVNQSLQQQGVHEAGFSVGRNQIDQYIYAIPQFQQDGQFSMPKYQRFIQSQGMNTNIFRQRLAQDMILAQLRVGIMESSFGLPKELQAHFGLLNQKRSVDYFAVNPDQLEQDFTINPAELKAYYQSHLKEFMAPEKVKLAYLKLSVPQIAEKIVIKDSEARQYFEKNHTSYRGPSSKQADVFTLSGQISAAKLKQLAQEIDKKLIGGQSIALIKNTLPKNVQLIQDKRTLNPKQLKDNTYIEGLSKIGQYSEAVAHDGKWEIYRFSAIVPGLLLPYDQVKSKIITTLKNQLAEKKYAEMGVKLDNLTFENPQTLKIAADKLSLKIKDTDWLTRQDGHKIWNNNLKVMSAAFSNSVLNEGNNSGIINLDANHAIVLRLLSHQAKHQLGFEVVKSQVIQRLESQKAHAKAGGEAQQIYHQLQQGKSVDQVAKTTGISFKSLAGISRNNSQLNHKFVHSIFSGSLANHGPTVSKIYLPKMGYVVYKLQKIEEGKPSAKASDKRVMSASYQQMLGKLDYQQYVQYLLVNAKIKYNQ